jgi:hypothetical protein
MCATQGMCVLTFKAEERDRERERVRKDRGRVEANTKL